MSTARQLREPAITEQDIQGEATHGKADPRPDPVAVSYERISQLVSTIDEETRKDWSITRDVMDGLMRDFEAEGDAIKRAVTSYAGKSVSLIDTSRVIRDAVERGRTELIQHLPSTVTALRRRQNEQD